MSVTTKDENGGDFSGRQRPTYDELVAENRRLKSQIQELQLLVEKLSRESKRQAAPFRKHEQPTANPKKPGRKSGRRHGPHAHRAIPPRVDETYDVPLPKHCPRCGQGDLRETQVAPQYQTEIPSAVIYRRFDVHVGHCDRCGHSVQGRHALQTSAARGAAGSQLGPNVHASLAILNKQLGVSHGKCVRLLGALFPELSIARGSSARSVARTAKRCQPAYEQLRKDIVDSEQVVPDETGWRVGGRSAWLHAFVGRHETCYVIDPTRGGEPAERLLERDWSGTLVHDGWSVYDRFTCAAHQQCLAHLQRRCQRLLETASRGAVRFPRAVLAIIDRAYALRRAWRGHRLDGNALADAGLNLACELESVAEGQFTHEGNRSLAGHLHRHAMHWFWFLIDPKIDATNYRAEQAIRPAVVNRKVWGGNRTWNGANAQSILTTVLRTCQQRAVREFDFLLRTLCSPTHQRIPP